ncbi:acyl-CoA dehydrogenase family protein [Pseudomonas aeruginosa]|uniref:acyl-CoA dehydrogenase family protein n=1 Tax=Pseudomonas aeruginosa TaxID=287 RepID=UPI003D9C1B63
MLEDALLALERKQFGQPIAEFQLIQAMLAETAKAEAYAARCMVIDAAGGATRAAMSVPGRLRQAVRLRCADRVADGALRSDGAGCPRRLRDRALLSRRAACSAHRGHHQIRFAGDRPQHDPRRRGLRGAGFAVPGVARSRPVACRPLSRHSSAFFMPSGAARNRFFTPAQETFPQAAEAARRRRSHMTRSGLVVLAGRGTYDLLLEVALLPRAGDRALGRAHEQPRFS